MPDFTSGDPAASSDEQINFVADGADDQTEQPTADNPVVLELNGRKFTKNDLVRKITHADAHIQKLEAEGKANFEKLSQLDARLKEVGDLKELLKTLKPDAKPAGTETKVTDETVDVEAKIAAALAAREAGEKAAKTEAEKTANWKTAVETLTKRYGKANTNARVQQAAQEAGLSLAEAAELARTKPTVFLKLFSDLEAPKPKPAPGARGTVNSAALDTSGQPRKPSGYAQAKTSRERIEIMQARFKELGL